MTAGPVRDITSSSSWRPASAENKHRSKLPDNPIGVALTSIWRRKVLVSTQHARRFSRRRFLEGVTLAGTAGLLGLRPGSVAAEPPPETTRIRLVQIPSICQAPSYVADELLRS